MKAKIVSIVAASILTIFSASFASAQNSNASLEEVSCPIPNSEKKMACKLHYGGITEDSINYDEDIPVSPRCTPTGMYLQKDRIVAAFFINQESAGMSVAYNNGAPNVFRGQITDFKVYQLVSADIPRVFIPEAKDGSSRIQTVALTCKIY
jgi:hypothetical protein